MGFLIFIFLIKCSKRSHLRERVSIKDDVFYVADSVLKRWMNLEPIIQSEINQKEKNKYHILVHIFDIYI